MRKALTTLTSLALAVGGIALAPHASASVTCPTVSGGTGATTPPATPGVNWSGCNLSNAVIQYTDLSGANLSGANLSGANLLNDTLNEVNLSNANLQGANFSFEYQVLNLNLTNANLNGADITASDLRNAIVTCSDTGLLGTGIIGTPSFLPTDWNFNAGTLSVPIVPCPATLASSPPLLMWQQAIGRVSANAACPDGYSGSWDTWPNGGKGGFVCNKFVPTYGN